MVKYNGQDFQWVFLDEKVLEGIRWSEALDFVFKDNMAKDPTLTWQYFASPHGFMRHYPGDYPNIDVL